MRERVLKWGAAPKPPKFSARTGIEMSSLLGNKTAPGRNPGLNKELNSCFLSCSGCASAEPYPSQNGGRLQPARSNRQAQITKHPRSGFTSEHDVSILSLYFYNELLKSWGWQNPCY